MVGLVFVALQRQKHPLPPRRVEPAVEAHVIADEDAVHADATVTPLQQVAQLGILQVRLEANVVVCGIGRLVAAQALAQHVALVAGGAARAVLVGAGCTAGALAHRAGDDTLAGRVLVGQAQLRVSSR